jgi:hypothetical protein
VTVESAPGSGACVHVRVPLPGEELHGTDKTEKKNFRKAVC